jgi:1,4-alpha-glucan branching enzyme
MKLANISARMVAMHSRSYSAASGRLQARQTVKPVNFICLAPEAREVFLSGDFNRWNPSSHPMSRHVDGSWHSSVPLKHGGHLYHFVVDGHPINDPRAQGLARNDLGQKVSMILVS